MTVHGKASSKLIFVTLYMYFGYSAADVIKGNNNSWRSKEEVFLFLDLISAIFWSFVLNKNLLDI